MIEEEKKEEEFNQVMFVKNRSGSIRKILVSIAVVWFASLVVFLGGMIAYEFKWWPYQPFQDTLAFVRGDIAENTSLWEKIINDMKMEPTRYMADQDFKKPENLNFRAVEELPLNERREKPLMYISDAATKGYRVLYGTFDFPQKLHGAVMLDERGYVKKFWQMSQEDVDWPHPADTNVAPQGFTMLRDGSVVGSLISGTSLVKYDYCGNELWRIEGLFHHSIAESPDGDLWAWKTEKYPAINGSCENGDEFVNADYRMGSVSDLPVDGLCSYVNNIVKIDGENGGIVKKFTVKDMMNANPNIDIFGIMQLDFNNESVWISEAGGGSLHGNDISPLTSELSDVFPQFSIGDLLISMRSANLIFVADQDTFQVKWWRQGATRRQHDTDWNQDGTISVFNNNMFRDYSNVVSIDPKNYEQKILMDGKNFGLYTAIKGDHYVLADGSVMMVSTKQGVAVETDKNGNINFMFINNYNESKDKRLEIAVANFFPLDYFKDLPNCDNQ